MAGRFRVGIIGMQPDRGWAVRAHVPALRALSRDFEIVGVANTNKASAQRAAASSDLSKAFADVAELVADRSIDVVTITVRVPYHLEIAKAAIEAGKHVYCEWPLGNGLSEAQEMAELARAKGVVAVAGTQAPLSPEIQYLRELIANGFVGEVLSTTLVARGGSLPGADIIPDAKDHAYLLDRANGATMLTIPVGHTIAALRSVLGEVAEVAALLATRRATALVVDSGKRLPVSAPDEVLISGVLANGVPMSVHYRGGTSRDGKGLFWEVHGTKGDIRLSGSSGHTQMVRLALTGARGEETSFQPLEVPASMRLGWPEDVEAGNVARVYARMAHDLRNGTRSAPSFDDAVAVHRVIAAIESAAVTGMRASIPTGC